MPCFKSAPANKFFDCLTVPRLTVLAVGLLAFTAQAGVKEVGAIGLTVNDLEGEVNFFTKTLSFELVSTAEVGGKDGDTLLGLKNVHARKAVLKLGDELITLTEFLSEKGKPIPEDSRSNDRWFQHIAIVVSDMDKAYEQLRDHKVMHVSTAPQTLPEWNKGAAGIKAFYFRDPENHVLEIIFFPSGKGDPKWQRPGANADAPVFLGIDHTAIVVSDTAKSLAFYRDTLGLKVAGESENYGIEQEHLNQLFGARLHITGLRAEHGPGIEFLEYIAPPGGRDLSPSAKAKDLVFWTTDLVTDDLHELDTTLHKNGVKFFSKPSGNPISEIILDPDGHALELVEKK